MTNWLMKAIADEIARNALAKLAGVCEAPEAEWSASTTTATGAANLNLVATMKLYKAMMGRPEMSLPTQIIESEYLTDSHTAIKRWRRRWPYRFDKVRVRTWQTPSEMVYVVEGIGLVMHPVRAREFAAVASCQLPVASCPAPKEAP